jgi:hypothetical protein
MAAGITSNVSRIVQNWLRRSQQLKPRMTHATADSTKTLWSESKRQLTKLIYDKPVPTRAQTQYEREQRSRAAGKTYRRRVWLSVRPSIGAAAVWASKIKVDVTRGRRPAWKRTGNLRRCERMVMASAYVGLVVNDAASKSKKKGRRGYSRARHYMKCRYPAPWRDVAISLTAPRRREIYHKAMREANGFA